MLSQKITQKQLNIINQAGSLKNKTIEVLKLIYDPEISVNIWDLGLVYKINIENDSVSIKMTLTSPTCPVAGMIVQEIKRIIKLVLQEVIEVVVDLVWEPRWNKSMMSEEARLILDL